MNSLWTGSLFGKKIPWIVIYPKQGPLLMKQIPYNILTRCPEPSSPVSRQNFIRQTSFPAPRAPNRISCSHTLIFMRCPRAIFHWDWFVHLWTQRMILKTIANDWLFNTIAWTRFYDHVPWHDLYWWRNGGRTCFLTLAKFSATIVEVQASAIVLYV